MEEIENKLISSYYIGFWLFLIAIFAFIAVIILLVIFRNIVLANYNNSITSKSVLWILILAIFMGLLFFIFKFTMYCKDFDNVKQRNFETITGKVIGYSSVGEGNDPRKPILGDPIFEIIETGERMRLNVGPTKINKFYTIIYLRNSLY